MTPLNQLSYEEFGKLRFLDFFPRTTDYSECEGGLESGIGLARCEGCLWTLFTSPEDGEWQTVEINLDFINGCPEAEGNEILKRLGLGLRRGMSVAQAKELLGCAREELPEYLRFVVGDRWPYYLDCFFGNDHDVAGLVRVWICRKDLADKEDTL